MNVVEMTNRLGRFLYENIRCMRHNRKSLKRFRLSYSSGLWIVNDGQHRMAFEHYPYLAFHDLEGYIYDDDWAPKPGMTVVDAGACRGEFSIYASKCVGPTGRVILLEPDAANVELSKRTLALNGDPQNIQIVQAGLWRERGSVSFETGNTDTSKIVTSPVPTTVNTVVVPVESLFSLVERCELKRLDFVKMDIEGAEVAALEGLEDLKEPFRPRFSIASYHLINGARTAEVLERVLLRNNYHVISGNERHRTTYASTKKFF